MEGYEERHIRDALVDESQLIYSKARISRCVRAVYPAVQ